MRLGGVLLIFSWLPERVLHRWWIDIQRRRYRTLTANIIVKLMPINSMSAKKQVVMVTFYCANHRLENSPLSFSEKMISPHTFLTSLGQPLKERCVFNGQLSIEMISSRFITGDEGEESR